MFFQAAAQAAAFLCLGVLDPFTGRAKVVFRDVDKSGVKDKLFDMTRTSMKRLGIEKISESAS